MGRFTTNVSATPQYNQQKNISYGSPYGTSQANPMMGWPTVFPKPIVGLEREGVIIEDIDGPISSNDQIKFIPGSLEAIRMMRLKGYKVMIINDQPYIQKNKLTIDQVDATNQYLMQKFGEAGIMSIDGLLYSTSDLKQDDYAKPNIGMFKKAENEILRGEKFKNGWFVGHNIKDAKAADKLDAIPVIVKTGNGKETLSKLDTFANKDLLKKTKVYSNLLEFAESLE